MKLTFVLSEYPPHAGSGVGTYYSALLPALVRRGHDVEVLLGGHLPDAAPPYIRDGVRVSPLPSARVAAALPLFSQYTPFPDFHRSLASAWALWEHGGRGEGRDVVEVVDWGLLFAPWVVEPGPPTVVQMHSSTGQIRHHDHTAGQDLEGEVFLLFETGLLAYADALHTHSESNAAWWRAATRRGVEVHPPPLADPQADMPEPSDGDYLFVAGRVQRWKGPEVLCQALRLLGDRAPRVVWAGRDEVYAGQSMEAYLAATYPEVWGPRVQSLGYVPRGEVTQLQAGAMAVVVPSLWDVYNLVAVEAMQAGTPVVVSDGAGAAELVEDGVNGLTFESGNAASLAAALSRVTSVTPEARRAMGTAGRQSVLDHLDPDAVAARKEAMYAEVVQAHSAGRARVPPWLARTASPHDAPRDPLAFLDKIALRRLAGYTARRAADKAWAASKRFRPTS